MWLLNASQIRKADQVMIEKHHYPSLLLMETAGRKSAEFILQHFPDQSVYQVLAGPGNNGGDGLVVARYLHQAGKYVNILLSHPPEQFQGDAKAMWDALDHSEVWSEVYSKTKHPEILDDMILIDALLGTGLEKAPRGAIASIIKEFRYESLPCVAIDLPSGLNADTGKVFDRFTPLQATYTLTFQCPKVCHYTTPASNFCGKTVTVDIGIRELVLHHLSSKREVVGGSEAEILLRTTPADTHKGKQGHSLLIGGSRAYAGAVALSAHAALHAGAGLSTALTTEDARAAIYAVGPEAMVKALPGHALADTHLEEAVEFIKVLDPDAVGIGPGMGMEAATLLPALLDCLKGKPVVLDADALNLLAENPGIWRKVRKNTILTPHPGEFSRLAGPEYDHSDRFHAAERFAREKKVVLVLKGAFTIIAAPDGETRVNASGNPGMATAGSGDVLTGVITALLARGYEPFEAATLGVYLHGLAGDLCAEEFGEAGVTASGIMRKLGNAAQLVQTGKAPRPLSI